jgi:hypothetical protein
MNERAYLAVLQWPDGLEIGAQAAAIAVAAGLDPYIAAQTAKRGTPQIIARLDLDAARAGADHLQAAGAMALATTQSEMAAPPDPAALKRLVAAPGDDYACESWRHGPVTLRMSDVFLMIRAHLRATETRIRGSAPGGRAALYVGGVAAGALAYAAYAADTPARSTKINVAEILDLWLRDGSRFRIDAEHFNFDVLGPERTPLGRQNMDLLARRLRAQAPRAIFDEGFANFRCPPELVRSHFTDVSSGSVKRTSEAPAFDFYSVWAYLMWRHMLAG